MEPDEAYVLKSIYYCTLMEAQCMADLKKMYGDVFNKIETYDNVTRFSRGEADDGSSSMTIHHIMPGVDVYYNNFNTNDSIEASYMPDALNIIEINHCRQGRFGCLLSEDRYVYLGEGEIEANILGIERITSEFPLGFYEGIGICLDVDKAAEYISSMFPNIARQIYLLRDQIKQNDNMVFIRRVPELNHIFEELYSVDPQIEQSYIKLKVLEIILMIQTVPYAREDDAALYFRRSDMEKVKALHNEAISRLGEKIPLSEMARRYDISQTALKSCFREIYGCPYYTYMKRYRVHKAVHMLEDKERSISDIAGALGYDNPSKFAAAFRSVMGCTPREYRKNSDHLEHLQLVGVEIE